MFRNSSDYHRLELSIAADPNDSRQVAPQVDPRHGRILDVGCGAGQTLMSCNLPGGVFAVGLDPDYSAIALGKQLTSAIRFVVGQGESLPFENECFDLVICRVALPYMHVSTALSEMARVTAAGGDLWLALHPFSMTVKELRSNVAHFQLKAGFYRGWVLINGLALHSLGKQWRWPSNPGRYETWQTSKGITRALRTAGFDQVRINRENHFIVTATKV